MNLAALSAVYPGYIKGQDQLAQLAVEKDKADAVKRQAIIEQGLGNVLAQGDQGQPSGGLGALASGPAPQGPGQASVPMQAGAPPPQGQPGGLAALSKGPPGPQGGPAPGQPPQGGPPQGAPQGQPQASGPMTVGQMAKQIMAANPQMDFKSPEGARALLGMVERNQQLLAPQAKSELAQISLAMKMHEFDQKLELGYANMDNKRALLDQANSFRMQIEQLKQSGAQAQLIQKLQAQSDAIDKKIDAAKDKTATTEEGKDRRSDAGIASREKISAERTKAIADKAKVTAISDDEANYIADAMKTDPTAVAHLTGSGPAGTANKQKVLAVLAARVQKGESSPDDLAKARVALGGSTAEARRVGTQAASVALGAQELQKFAPLVLAASDKIDRTQYPTVNRLVEAASKGTGGTEIITLANNINALKNAYSQVIARGGQVTEGARKQASDLIDVAYSKGQIKAAIAAMVQEAKGAGEAAATAKGDVRASVGAKGSSPAAEAPAGPARVKYDAQGNRIP